ncbi:MAG TPA: VTT domain-containing protein, partial [Chloroflexota bacterium]|nr:VTT domain-containing protein [Chloroflexota bacterium]
MINARKGAAVVGLLLLAVVLAVLVALRPNPASLAAFGYPGVAIVMFLTSSTIFFPAPGFAAVLAAGTLWNPLLVGISAGLGAATGELSGYLIGAGGGTLLDLQESKNWKKASALFSRYGLWAILVLAIIPNPFFDAMGILAGSLSYSVRRFWVVCLAGKIIKFVAMAYL